MFISPKSTSHQWLVVVALTLGLAATTTQLASADPYPWADNVCNKSVPVKKDIVIEQPVEYQIKVQSMCGIMPCIKTRTETRQDQTIKTIVLHENRVACCDGYAETPARQCAPICLDSCNNGKCVAPNVCKCQPEPSETSPGFVGPTCKRFICLARQRWGAKCERECPTECSQNSYCSADTGKCLCYPGWHGPECSLECDANSDADDCQETGGSIVPVIAEPDANLILASGNLQESNFVSSRSQRPQALVLGDESNTDGVEIIASKSTNDQIWNSFTSSYLVGLLGLMSLVLLVAFLIERRRSRLFRNELYYASAASAASGRSGPGSEYSLSADGSSYYSTSGRRSSSSAAGGHPDKNASFATATRNILTGIVGGVAQSTGKSSDQTAAAAAKNKLLLIAPRAESHLIRSQRQAEQNIYSDIDIATQKAAAALNPANRSRAATPTRLSAPSDEDHIYAVPKMSPIIARSDDDDKKQHDISVEMGHDEHDDSNIYEELKPRGASNNNTNP